MTQGSHIRRPGPEPRYALGGDIFSVPLSIQVQKWAPVDCSGNLTESLGAICDGLASHLEKQLQNFLSGNGEEIGVK